MSKKLKNFGLAGRGLGSSAQDNGWMAIPNLRAELLAMAGTTVTKWALHGTLQAHIMGDILLAKAMTAGQMSPRSGALVVARTGGKESSLASPSQVGALYQLACHFELLTFDWDLEGRHLRVDGTRLRNSTTWRQSIQVEAATVGAMCYEWLPYATVADLRLHDGSRCSRRETGLHASQPNTPMDAQRT
ncbi:hypothetical protein PInf_001691 [Phytophthora infestans]|nr:hypothetical protein PInf_000156 [Phytophthora infestans]KAI9997760.1 hypothetical protein PInf_001691 [Phytophthora infestans]